MPRRHLHLPPQYSNLLGRFTLVALLLAGGSGITWDLYQTQRSASPVFNEQLVAANDVLLNRAMSVGDVHRGEGKARSLADTAAPPGDVASFTAGQ